jgi:hypothetical protein
MSRICPSCGIDPGFDVARCPTCGTVMISPPPAADVSSAPAGGVEWEKTVVEPAAPKAVPGRKVRFDKAREFYEPIETGGPAGAAPGTDRASDDAADQGKVGRTVVDRPSVWEDDDATVVVRSGRRGLEGPLAYVVERSGVRAGKIHPVRTETTIGRSADNDVVLTDESVSKRHARITLDGAKFIFWDLASTNYSRIVREDGSRARILDARPLEDGDTIDLGEARVTFLIVEQRAVEDES